MFCFVSVYSKKILFSHEKNKKMQIMFYFQSRRGFIHAFHNNGYYYT